MMISLSKITIIMALSSMMIANYPSFAMHDSTLDMNTWIMGDNSTDLHTTDLGDPPEGSTDNETMIIEQPSQYQWLTYDDPILQFSIEYPSTWTIEQGEDVASFDIPESEGILSRDFDFNVFTEPFLSLDPSEYARDTLNELRGREMKIIGLNETSINGQPAAQAQYHINYSGGSENMILGYFMVTDDFTGYHLSYGEDVDQFSRYLPLIERMISTFRITT